MQITGSRAYRKAALDKEDQAPRECGALAENGQNILARYIACIHIQLHCNRIVRKLVVASL